MKWSICPPENEEKYRKACHHYAVNGFGSFKRDKDYGMILEGNEKDVGIVALKNIQKNGGVDTLLKYADKFKENETIGEPPIFNYIGFGEFAPSTLRYVNTALEIKTLVKDPKKIIEIGGGYGGLCKIMSVLNDWETYKITEVDEACELCDKYIKAMNLNAEVVSQDIDEECDLLIADSSMSECDLETQMKYLKLIVKAKYIYIVYNTLALQEGVNNFFTLLKNTLMYCDMRIEHTYEANGTATSSIVSLFITNKFR
jgi:hypothetical protein